MEKMLKVNDRIVRTDKEVEEADCLSFGVDFIPGTELRVLDIRNNDECYCLDRSGEVGGWLRMQFIGWGKYYRLSYPTLAKRIFRFK